LPALEELEEMSTLELEFTEELDDVPLELDSAKELLDSTKSLEDKDNSLDEDSSKELLELSEGLDGGNGMPL
jgi:hypothetical protein